MDKLDWSIEINNIWTISMIVHPAQLAMLLILLPRMETEIQTRDTLPWVWRTAADQVSPSAKIWKFQLHVFDTHTVIAVILSSNIKVTHSE